MNKMAVHYLHLLFLLFFYLVLLVSEFSIKKQCLHLLI